MESRPLLRCLAMLAVSCFSPNGARGQLTTGIVTGCLRSAEGVPLGRSPLMITGAVGFQMTLRTNPDGTFRVVLPYGRYHFAGASVYVEPLQTTHVDLRSNTPLRQIQPRAGLWTDETRARVYPEPFSLAGTLLSREPTTVTQPLDFTGHSDNRLRSQSQRAESWTATKFLLHGMDATDSYQPGRPAIFPDPQAFDEVSVRGGPAQTTSAAYGTEVGLFLREPGSSWHGSLTSMNTGSSLSSSNLPLSANRGLVQQPEVFQWFTRDALDVGGPLAPWADVFVSAAGQWASQTVPLTASGTDQNSRLLFANARGRVRASARDQLDGVYVGSRIDLSDWATPVGIEDLAANRVGPVFVLPAGFAGESEVDHLDFVQTGWTHVFSGDSPGGAVQIRYSYSTAHLDAQQTGHGAGPTESRIDLLNGSVTGAPPLRNFAVRMRHDVRAAWQPAHPHTGPLRHEIVVGGEWSTATPRNRFNVPSNFDLVTANGVPAFIARFNTPLDAAETIHSLSGLIGDRVALPAGWILDAGFLLDLARGSVPGRSGTRIAWNSASPRAGLAWRIPRLHGLMLRANYLRVYAPLAGRYLDFGNPESLSGSEYAWIDRNGDGVFQPNEQGPLLFRFGGLYSSVAPSIRRPYVDEFDIGADVALRQTHAGVHLFRRDEQARIAAINAGVPAAAFTPVSIVDPGPDGIAGTFDDQPLTVYEQSPSTFGQDRYLLTNPPGLRELYTGVVAEVRQQWHGMNAGASLAIEKSWGPTNPGDSVLTNDPGVVGALFLDPNTSIHSTGHDFLDRAYVGKLYASYQLPWQRIEVGTVAGYLDGLVFARQLLVTGLAQGPFVVATTARGSPEGGNRAEHVTNWNLRIRREFHLPLGRIEASADLLNVTNAGHSIQQNDLTGPAFLRRLPIAIQPPRSARLGFRLEF